MSITKTQLARILAIFWTSLGITIHGSVGLRTEDAKEKHWSYVGDHGESAWDQSCSGHSQSPVDIQTKKAIYNASLKLELKNYHVPVDGKDWLLVNTGHSAKLMPATETTDQLTSTISGSVFGNQTYRLVQFHFHWHEEDEKGSEHAIDGHRFAAELHFVHQNTKYQTMEEAKGHKDGFAVLAVLFRVARKNNLYLHPFVRTLPLIKHYPSNTSFEEKLYITNLLPNDLSTFYTYKGSFTTPPCLEAVNWVIFKEFAGISTSQLKQFRELHGPHSRITHNIRSVQKLNDRVVATTDPSLNHGSGASLIPRFSLPVVLILTTFLKLTSS